MLVMKLSRVRKIRCVISRGAIQIPPKSSVLKCQIFICIITFCLFCTLSICFQAEVPSEGRWQWSDCHHCQELRGTVHTLEAVEGCGHGWNQDLRVRICTTDTYHLYVHTHMHMACVRGDLSWMQCCCSSCAGTVCLLSPPVKVYIQMLHLLLLFPRTAQVS